MAVGLWMLACPDSAGRGRQVGRATRRSAPAASGAAWRARTAPVSEASALAFRSALCASAMPAASRTASASQSIARRPHTLPKRLSSVFSRTEPLSEVHSETPRRLRPATGCRARSRGRPGRPRRSGAIDASREHPRGRRPFALRTRHRRNPGSQATSGRRGCRASARSRGSSRPRTRPRRPL